MKSLWATPRRFLLLFIILQVVVWTAHCCGLWHVLAKDNLESVIWGGEWQLGYYKHPPLAAWAAYAFSWLCGYQDWALYLLAQLAVAVGVVYVYRLAREFFDEPAAAAAALLLYALYWYNPSPMIFCPNTVQVALQPVMAFYFYRALKDDRWRDWLLYGFFSGAALWGKYSAGLLLVAFLVYMLADHAARRRFASPRAWAAAGVIVLVFSPHLWWLYAHDFSCLDYVSRSLGKNASPHGWLLVLGTALFPFLLEGACLLISLFVGGGMRCRAGEPTRPGARAAEAGKFALFATLLPAAYFLYLALKGDQIQPMWFSTTVSFTGIALVAFSPWKITEKVFRWLGALLLVYTAVVFVACAVDSVSSPEMRRHLRPGEILAAAENYYRGQGGRGKIPAVLGSRWPCGVVGHYAAHRPPVIDMKDEITLRRYLPRLRRQGALLVCVPKDREGLRELLTKHRDALPMAASAFAEIPFTFRTESGKAKTSPLFFAYLPPAGE